MTTPDTAPRLPRFARVHLNGHHELGLCALRVFRASPGDAGPQPDAGPQGPILVEATELESGEATVFPLGSIYRLDVATDAGLEVRRSAVAREVVLRREVAIFDALRAALAECTATVRASAQGAWCVRVDLDLDPLRGAEIAHYARGDRLTGMLADALWGREVPAECVVKRVDTREGATLTFEVCGLEDISGPTAAALKSLGFGSVVEIGGPDSEPFQCFSDEHSPF